jgi:hypothetical protein
MSKSQFKIIAFGLFILFAIGVFIFLFKQNNKNRDNEKDTISEKEKQIALICNGEKVFKSDTQKLSKLLELNHKNQLTPEQLQKEVQNSEQNELIGQIRQIILKQNIKKYGLTVTQDEVNSKVNKMFEMLGTQRVNESIELSNAIYEALREWQKNPSQSDSIYKEKLAGKNFSEYQWETHKIIYDSPDELKRMVIPQSIEDMKKNSFESSKRDLLLQQLMDIVTKNVTVTDDEINKAFQKKYDNVMERPSLDQVKNDIRKTLLEEKKNEAINKWWTQQFHEAQIESKDSLYNAILERIQNGDAKGN